MRTNVYETGSKREDQRARDEAQWRREDRHRFAEQRRLIYLQFLTSIQPIEQRLDTAQREILLFEFRKGGLLADSDQNWLEAFGVADWFDQITNLRSMRSNMLLLTSSCVVEQAEHVIDDLIRCFSMIDEKQRLKLDGLQVSIQGFQCAVRQDLG